MLLSIPLYPCVKTQLWRCNPCGVGPCQVSNCFGVHKATELLWSFARRLCARMLWVVPLGLGSMGTPGPWYQDCGHVNTACEVLCEIAALDPRVINRV